MEPRSLETYKNSIRNNFSFLKQTKKFDELITKNLPLENDQGYLVPICELHTTDNSIIKLLAKWREDNFSVYPSQFPVTIEGTAKWLRSKILDVEDRILFLVLDKHGEPVGHLGLANGINEQGELEIDNVVRGVADLNPGIMSSAMKTLLNWSENIIGSKHNFLRVFSDNEHAIKFYKRLDFVDGERIPLRRHQEGDSIFFRPLESNDHEAPDKYFLRMDYKQQELASSEKMILTAGPSISAKEVSYANDAVRNGWNNRWSEYITRFEKTFADYIGVKHALSTSSCTGALHIALAALGIGLGDEVIVPDITWVATANAVAYVGATPIFADVDEKSWCLDPASFESKITSKTKAVIPVHLYGHPAPVDQICAIARKHKLYIIEDAAPAIGAECNGRKTGTFGDFAAFSFQGAKLAVTGEGGMLVTNDPELYKKAYALWDQGRVPGTFWINQNGLKYKMSNVQAAIGLGQIERVEDLIEAKRRIFSWYAAGLKGVSHIELNYEMPWARSIYWMTSIKLADSAPVKRDELRELLKARNVDTRPVFPAISQYPHWVKPQEPQPIALKIGNSSINLPSGGHLKEAQINYICKCIKEILVK